jgi:hypothetical protein
MSENAKGAAPVKSGSQREAPTNTHSNTAPRGHDPMIRRLSRRRDCVDRIRFILPDAGDGGAAEPDYIKRARRRRWAS